MLFIRLQNSKPRTSGRSLRCPDVARIVDVLPDEIISYLENLTLNYYGRGVNNPPPLLDKTRYPHLHILKLGSFPNSSLMLPWSSPHNFASFGAMPAHSPAVRLAPKFFLWHNRKDATKGI